MSWNQGNGNGNQTYGTSNGGMDDVYGRLNNTRDVGGARFPFIEKSGKYALVTLEEFSHSSDGPSARALLEELASGSCFVKIWKLVKPPYKPGMTTDADQFADFCRKLKGAPVGYPIGNDIRVLMKERVNDQLARGTVIEAVAAPKEYVKRDGSKAVWTNVYWVNVQQSPQEIVATRQRLELKGIPVTGSATQAQQAPAQLYSTAYSTQAQQAPAQLYSTAYSTQAQQAPAQSYSTAYSTPPQAAPAPAAAPQGGFLAQIPPGPQGPQGGGNTGSGTW